MRTFLLAMACFASAPAGAFCGTYLGNAGASLYNETSQVVLVRQGDVTTLTLAADYAGSMSNFGLVIPVPEGLTEADVRLVDPDVIELIDVYSSPRLVEYTCADVYSESQSAASMCANEKWSGRSYFDPNGPKADGSVSVEAEFAAGEYQFVVLAATGADGLQTWLDANGYAVPQGGADVLQDYIDGGSQFLAAKVLLDQVPTGQSWLTPIQIAYASKMFSLPVLIGTISAQSEQELLIYAISDNGQVGISNYDEFEVESECMFTGKDFGVFYEDLFDQGASDTTAGWLLEYSWSPVKCDPCTTPSGEALDSETLAAVGWSGSGSGTYYGGGGGTPHFSRLHMRYDPADLDQDLALYLTGDSVPSQLRYVKYLEELEFMLPICGEGFAPDPGHCPTRELRASRAYFLLFPLILIPLFRRRR